MTFVERNTFGGIMATILETHVGLRILVNNRVIKSEIAENCKSQNKIEQH